MTLNQRRARQFAVPPWPDAARRIGAPRLRTGAAPQRPGAGPLRVTSMLIVALVLLLGCAARAGTAPSAEVPSPFADCAAVTTAASDAAAPKAPAAGPLLPDLVLPCFTGGQPVRLRDLRGPAVINVWQSACAPCREELPAFQRLAERTVGRVNVLGVVSRDSREAARSFAEDLRIGFPNVDDPDMRLLNALGRTALPVTVFVDPGGVVRHVYTGRALEDATLGQLVRSHLGVAVTP